MAENGTWLKQYRKELDSAVFQQKDPYIQKVWDYCKMRANFIPSIFEGITINEGEFVTSRESGAKFCKMPEFIFYRRMQKLQQMGNITLKSHNKFTIVSLCQWRTYNGEENNFAQQLHNNCTTTAQQPHTSIEGKEREEGKEIKNVGRKRPDARDYSSDFLTFWNLYPKVGRVKKPDAWKAWQKAIQRTEAKNVIAAVTNYASSETGMSDYAGHASTWLNGDRWEEDPETWRRNGRGPQREPSLFTPSVKYLDMTPEEKAAQNAER